MHVSDYEGMIVNVGLTQAEAAILAAALDAHAEAVLEPNTTGKPDLYDVVSNMAAHMATIAHALELRGKLYDAMTAGKQWSPTPTTEPEPAPLAPWRRFVARILSPFVGLIARSAKATAALVWILGPEAARVFVAATKATGGRQ